MIVVKTTSFLFFLSIIFIINVKAEAIRTDPDILMVSANAPPYVFRNKEGHIIGSSVDQITDILKKSGLSYSFQILPWLRAMEMVKKQNNVLFYPLSRTPEREKSFKWIMPLHKLQLNMYGIKGKVPSDVTDLNLLNYRFSCVDKSILCSVIKSWGVKDENIIKLSTLNLYQMTKLMFYDRTDFTFITKDNYLQIKNSPEFITKEFVALKNYSIVIEEYLVANPHMDQHLIDKLTQAIHKP